MTGVARGEVYQLDLEKQGGRLKKSRPVLIVQNNVANRHSPETIVLAIRDPHGGRMLPVFVLVGKGMGGLLKESVIDAGHIYTVAGSQLGKKMGTMPDSIMEQVDVALKTSLQLK